MGFTFKLGKNATKSPITPYSDIEQGSAMQEIPVPPSISAPSCPECAKINKVLENQAMIVENQQIILNAIGGTQELIKSLANSAEEEPEEPTEDEIKEAIIAARKKKMVTAKNKGGRPRRMVVD